MHTPAYSSSTSNSARSDPSSPSIRNSMKRERNFDHDVDESEISLLFLSHPSISASIDNTNANLMQAYDNSNGNLATAIANANGSSAIDAAVASAFLHKKTASSSTLLDGISTDVDHRYNSRSPKLPKTRSTHSQRKASEVSLSSIMARANMLDSPSSSSITNDQSIFNNNNGNNHGNGNTSSNSNGDDDGDDSFSDRGEEEDDASSPSNNQLWTLEEDQLLLQKQEEIGNKWAHIISYLPHRNQNQLKVRFKSILRASRREWTAQENNLLIQLHHESKADWSIIAPCFPHRTKNAVKKHHRFLVKMKKDNLYPLPPAHGAPNQIFYDKEGLHNKIRELANIMLPSPNKDEKPGTSPLLNTIEAVHLQGNNNNSNSSSSSNSNNASDSSMSRFNPSPVHLTHLPISDSKNFSTVKARNASPDSHHLLFQQQQQQQLQQQQQSEQQHQHQQQYVQHHHHHHQQQQQQHVQVQQPNWTPNVYNSQQQQQQQHVNVGMPVSNVSGAPFMGGLLHTDSHLDAGASGHMIVRSNPSPAVVTTTTTGSTTTAPSTPANVAYQQQQQQQHTVASTSPFPFRSPLKARKNSKQAVVPASLKQDKLKTTPDGKKTIAQPGMHPSDQSHHVHHHQQYQQQQQQQTMYNNMPAQNLSMNNYQPNQYQQQIYQHQQQINQHQQQQYHQAMNQAPPPLPPQQQFFFPPIYQLPYPGHDGFDDLLNTVDFSLDDDDKTIFGNQ